MVTRTVYLCLLVLLCRCVPAAGPFDFAQLRERTAALAQEPYRGPTNRVSQQLLDLSYVQRQAIQFRPQKALWVNEGLPFAVEFFLPDAYHPQTVTIHEVSPGGIRRVPFSPDLFTYGTNRLQLPPDLDFAGFRIVQPQEGFGEVAVFLGASYFRMIGRGQVYGASARGLSLNTVLMQQEEFPLFREFWLRRPGQGDPTMTVWALLDSPSVAGAYEFLIVPGKVTVAQIKAALFPRREVKEFGVAPLTSMFLYDETSHPPLSDFRPEVHDSDGLLIDAGHGPRRWRPLESSKMMRVNAYLDINPKGFGLIQRDREFEHYQDLVARFEMRPNVWIKPIGNWGSGQIELVQLPTNIEYTDNVVAFWVPAHPPKPGQAFELAYEIQWFTNEVASATLGYVRSTRIGLVRDENTNRAPNLRFVIDFAGKVVESLTAGDQLDAEVNYGEGTKLVADTVAKNPLNGTWRLVVEFAAPKKAVDLEAVLKRRGQPVTETWTYTWQP